MIGFQDIGKAGVVGALTCGALLGGNAINGLPSTHSPFFPEEDYVLPLNRCEPVMRELENMHPAKGSVSFTAPDGRTLKLTMDALTDPYSETYYAEITHGGDVIASAVQMPLVSTVVGLLPTQAICQDLNGDGVTDFITDHSKHGNGLGASFFDRLVILSSSAGGYRHWILQTMDPSAADYVTFGQLEPAVMVTTSYARSEEATPHSYYVYDLWGFRDGEIVLANNIDPRFPKWVWMTFAENHKPATSLSEESRRRMLDPRRATEVRVSEPD